MRRRSWTIQEEFGSFTDYIWGFVDGEPVLNRWRRQQDVTGNIGRCPMR